MNDELTAVDIKKMKEELEYRTNTLRGKLIAEVQYARSFGDLSENFEYKAAKQEKNRNESRIRYLERMIASAKVIEVSEKEGIAGLFSRVTFLADGDDEPTEVRIVTTLRQNPLEGLISKESPVGRALLGRKVGDRVTIRVSDDFSYDAVIQSIEPGEDDESLEIMKF
ncbi:MAG: GreA/GreB family elongation factor [Oscillospiraceae bacterium]|nr:GreA/GreB family elongation factor [Oscillospiraceae bacterium]